MVKRRLGTSDLAILGQGRYARFVAARTASVLGSAMAPIALAFAILGLPHRSAADLGLALAARAGAQVILVVVGGVIGDRFSRYRLMVSADVAAGISELGIAALFLTSHVTLGAVIVLSALNGAASAMFFPASAGLIPQIVESDQLQPANALLRLATNGAAVLGAVLAGVVIAVLNPAWALFIDGVTFFASAGLLAGLAIPPIRRARRSTMVEDLGHGWREFTARPWVWIIVVQFALSNACFTAGITVLGPIISLKHYGGAPGYSAMRAAQAAGLLLGSVVALRLRPRRPMFTATVATFAFAPPLLFMAAGAPLWSIVVLMFIDGVCADVFEVLWSTALQVHIPEESLSRVSAYDRMGSLGLAPIATAAVGPAADAVGLVATLAIGGAVVLVATMGALGSRSVRSVRSERL